jgi:hypothetical protein
VPSRAAGAGRLRSDTVAKNTSIASWASVPPSNPRLGLLRPDVEALLVRAPERGRTGFTCHIVPIDACYELVGRLRQVWRGFDGGTDAHEAMDAFFATVSERSRPAPERGGGRS